MATIVESVFNGRDNEIIINLKLNGEGFAFITMGVTKIEAIIAGVTTSSDDGYITFDDEGNVTLKLGQSGLTAGDYESMVLVAYDDSHPNGQVIVSPGMRRSKVTVKIFEGS